MIIKDDEQSIAKVLCDVGMNDDYNSTAKLTGKNKQAVARCQSSDSNRIHQSQQLVPTTKSSGNIQTYKVLKQLNKIQHGNSRPKTAGKKNRSFKELCF